MQNADNLINTLAPEIDRKCEELRELRKEKIQNRLFILLCMAVIIIPALLVFIGVSLTIIIVPILFMSLCVVLLLPTLLNGLPSNQGGKIYEQA